MGYHYRAPSTLTPSPASYQRHPVGKTENLYTIPTAPDDLQAPCWRSAASLVIACFPGTNK